MPAEPDEKDRSNWSEDQRTRGYYYDDAHGYEKYEPEKDDEIDDLDKEAN